MVKKYSRKIKKRGGDKHHLGGETPYDDTNVIPPGTVDEKRHVFENALIETNKPDEDDSKKTIEHTETNFQFTRHVLSCNNIDMGKHGQFISKLTFGRVEVGKDFEPGATVYGIFETIKYAQQEGQKSYFNFDHVYVSNLYRTWITAVLLYGTNLTPVDKLNLYVSPYLKEFHGQLETGNFPKPIAHMASKFRKFLNELHIYCTTESDIDELFPEDKRMTWYSNLPNTIVLTLPPKKGAKEAQEIKYEKNGNEPYKLSSFCGIEDSAGPNNGPEFTKTGNLKEFMDWYNSDSNYYKKHHQKNKVHIVTHSHIMRDYLKSFPINIGDKEVPFDLDELKKDTLIGPIRNSNSWHFITTKDKNLENKSIAEAILEFDLKEGVPIEKKTAENAENKFKTHSLCGKSGSVEPVSEEICGLKGGRKIGKKRRYKTKKRSKRKNNKSRKHHK